MTLVPADVNQDCCKCVARVLGRKEGKDLDIAFLDIGRVCWPLRHAGVASLPRKPSAKNPFPKMVIFSLCSSPILET